MIFKKELNNYIREFMDKNKILADEFLACLSKEENDKLYSDFKYILITMAKCGQFKVSMDYVMNRLKDMNKNFKGLALVQNKQAAFIVIKHLSDKANLDCDYLYISW